MEFQAYVLHVKTGYEDREKSIIEQFSKLNLPFDWILDYDKDDITQEILDEFGYKGDMNIEAVSCALKHICAWKQLAESNHTGAFFFEDDVIVDVKNFKHFFSKAFVEYKEKWPACSYISLGSGCALYVPWTKKRKNTYLYPAQYARAADSYWMSRKTARKMIHWINVNGFTLPADHLIDHICKELDIPILWLEPTVADQGSHTGLFPSSIQDLERGKLLDRLEWKVKIFRRKYLYPLMGRDLTRNK